MAYHQLKQLVFPCLYGILFLILSIGPFSLAMANQCRCPGNDQGRRSNYTLEDATSAFKDLYLVDQESGIVRMVSLNSLRKKSGSHTENTAVLSTMDHRVHLWRRQPDGAGVDEASFSITIVYQPLYQFRNGILAFLLLPVEILVGLQEDRYGVNGSLANHLLARDVASLNLSSQTHRSTTVGGRTVFVNIGHVLANRTTTARLFDAGIMGVYIDIYDDVAAGPKYSVWIDYDCVGHVLSVYVDVEGKPKPDNTIAEVHLNISSVVSEVVSFGLLSTATHLLHSENLSLSMTVEDLPYYPYYRGGFLSRKVTVLSSVLGSVAATAVMATAFVCYFNSRYRRWHKDLEQLARSMERLPGVPTKVEFADIKKATSNFHETMKLGGGGFGTVYRCTLPATASKMDRAMDVAVKRFTRDVQNRRYDDFLAEVSIINRLRHKNIVPLVGWSYNKGEPLLVFEFMTNGSLDQHLFPKGGSRSSSRSGQRCTGASTLRWTTRYEIVRDIATGLHYVHHEYEPMVLHRDIKASNVMLDSSFRARLGDFGLACTVAVDRNSATGIGGTWGYIAPEYALCGRATRQTDIYALGILILEVVTGKRALSDDQLVDDDDVHITDWVWRLHSEGRLPECVDAVCTASEGEEQLYTSDDAERLLLLGLACSNPNPSDRPTMPDVVQVISKSAQPPTVPIQKPRFVWPPPEEQPSLSSDGDSTGASMMMSNLDSSIPVEMHARLSLGQPATQARGVFRVRQEYSV